MLLFLVVLKSLKANLSKIYSIGGGCLVMACCTTFFCIVTEVQSRWNTVRVATTRRGYSKHRIQNTDFLFIMFKIIM